MRKFLIGVVVLLCCAGVSNASVILYSSDLASQNYSATVGQYNSMFEWHSKLESFETSWATLGGIEFAGLNYPAYTPGQSALLANHYAFNVGGGFSELDFFNAGGVPTYYAAIMPESINKLSIDYTVIRTENFYNGTATNPLLFTLMWGAVEAPATPRTTDYLVFMDSDASVPSYADSLEVMLSSVYILNNTSNRTFGQTGDLLYGLELRWSCATDNLHLNEMSFSHAPEPGTVALLAIGGLVVLAKRRRNKSRLT